MEQSATKGHKKDDNLLVMTKNKRSDGEKSRHRQQVKDKVKSDKTEIVPTNSNVNDGADDKMKDKVKDEITANTASDDGAGDNVKDKVKDKIKDEVTADTGRSRGVGDRDEFNHRLIFDGRRRVEVQENNCADGSSSACPLVVEDGNRKTLMK